jgi:N-acetylneuraminate synthase
MAAATLGASILEFHVVFDPHMFGPDTKSSLTIQQVKHLVAGVRMIEVALSSGHLKNDASSFSHLKTMFGKSLAVNKSLAPGHRIAFTDLESKKPGDQGIPAKEFQRVIGRELKHAIAKWSFLREEDMH